MAASADQREGKRLTSYNLKLKKVLKKIRNFLKEVSVEMKKVAWPTRNELFGSTIVVIVGVIIMAVFIGICDFIFSKAIHFIIR